MLNKKALCLFSFFFAIFFSIQNVSAATLDGSTSNTTDPNSIIKTTDTQTTGTSNNTGSTDNNSPVKADCNALEGTLTINNQTSQNSTDASNQNSDSILGNSGANVFSTDDQIAVTLNLNQGGLPTDPSKQYQILISSGTGSSGSSVIPLKSLLGNSPFKGAFLIGGIINKLADIQDITLPFGFLNDDSVSVDTVANSSGPTTFLLNPLRQEGTHYVKLLLDGQNDPVCTFGKTVEISNSVSNYICEVRGGSNKKGTACSVGAGEMCPGGNSVNTAIGCVPTDPKGLIDGLLGFITRAAGGVALIIMAIASFNMITSQGNAEELKKAQEKFRDAIIGLLFIILAVTILQIIGVDILQIPGLTR